MSRAKEKQDRRLTGDTDQVTELKKITRLLEIMVRLNLRSMRGDHSQNDMISMLDSVGCGQSEIATLLATTTNTVNASLYKAKRRVGKK
jgi:DNA-directed RNA polymerase specialized sigma24 family protein